MFALCDIFVCFPLLRLRVSLGVVTPRDTYVSVQYFRGKIIYYLKKKDGDSVYSVDRFTFDFYFLPEGGLYDLLKTSLDLLTLEYRQQFSVQNFSTNRLGFEKLVYQFDHLHVELWRRENTVAIARYIPDDDEYLKAYVAGEKQCVLRLDFNPNKCKINKPLQRIMRFSPAVALIQFVKPDRINDALKTLNYRTRKKLKDDAFNPLEVRQDLFSELLQEYFDLYKLPMQYRRGYEKQFAPENLG